MISVLPIVEELRLMKHFIEGEKMMSMLTRNLGKEDTRWTLATCTMVSSCQDVSPAGSRRCSCLGARIRTVRVWSRAVSEPSRISQCPEKRSRPQVWAFSVLLGPSRGLLWPSRGLLGDSRTFWDLLGPSGTVSDLLRVLSGLLLPSQSHLWT